MEIRTNNISKWLEIFHLFENAGLPPIKFCEINNINYKSFSNFKYRVQGPNFNDPEQYDRNIQLAIKWRSSGIPKADFARRHNLNPNKFADIFAHMKVKSHYEEYKNKMDEIEINNNREQDSMEFIKISPGENKQSAIERTSVLPVSKSTETEVLEPRNNIELSITQGVKVIVSPEFPSEKIIKIIELLKDL